MLSKHAHSGRTVNQHYSQKEDFNHSATAAHEPTDFVVFLIASGIDK